MKLETLMEQCGSKCGRILDFKKKLIVSLNLLAANQDIAGYSISKEGLVTIQRKEQKGG